MTSIWYVNNSEIYLIFFSKSYRDHLSSIHHPTITHLSLHLLVHLWLVYPSAHPPLTICLFHWFSIMHPPIIHLSLILSPFVSLSIGRTLKWIHQPIHLLVWSSPVDFHLSVRPLIHLLIHYPKCLILLSDYLWTVCLLLGALLFSLSGDTKVFSLSMLTAITLNGLDWFISVLYNFLLQQSRCPQLFLLESSPCFIETNFPCVWLPSTLASLLPSVLVLLRKSHGGVVC